MSAKELEGRAQFEEVLASLATIDRLKSREDVLALEASLASRKAEVAQRVREVYTKQGISVSDRLIEEGVNAYFDQRLTFHPPKFGAAAGFAKAWINRRRIAKITSIATLSCAAALLAVNFGVVRPLHARAVARHLRIQQDWTSASHAVTAAEDRLALIAKGAKHECDVVAADGDAALKSAASRAREEIDRIAAQSAERSSASEKLLVPKDATPDREGVFDSKLLADAEEKSRKLGSAEKAFNQLASAMDQVVDHLRALRGESDLLNAAWAAFASQNPPSAAMARTRVLYDEGTEQVRSFGLAETVSAKKSEIQKISAELRLLSSLPDEIEATAGRAVALSKDPKANELIARLSRDGRGAAETGDVKAAQKALAEINGVSASLQQTYTLRIVNRPSEYSRLWYNNPSRTGRIYYIVVEAISADEQVIPMEISSEQDGSTRKVLLWAERVDEATYERVGADKKEDGVIQDDVFGKKERGFLDSVYSMGAKASGGDPNKGRLNSWPRRSTK